MKLNTYLVFIIALSQILFAKSSSAQCIVGNCENGYSVFKLENGDMYTGNWENGARHGYGRYDWANGAFMWESLNLTDSMAKELFIPQMVVKLQVFLKITCFRDPILLQKRRNCCRS